MSYAGRLVQMSRPVAKASPVAASLTEVHEEHEVAAPVAAAAEKAVPASVSRTEPVVVREIENAIERRVERETVVQDRATPPKVVVTEAVASPSSPIRTPASPPPWHAEDPEGDPLERVEADADLRAVLRAVRAWTAEPVVQTPVTQPAPIEITNVVTAEPSPTMVQAREQRGELRRDDSTQVSIGNVLITVEDAPAPRGAPRPQPPRIGETASRLARHYLRGR